MSRHYLYILSSKKHGVLYIGVTNDLSRRIYEHKMNLIPGFTSQYNVHILVKDKQGLAPIVNPFCFLEFVLRAVLLNNLNRKACIRIEGYCTIQK